jgi:hypothetical protein
MPFRVMEDTSRFLLFRVDGVYSSECMVFLVMLTSSYTSAIPISQLLYIWGIENVNSSQRGNGELFSHKFPLPHYRQQSDLLPLIYRV